VKNESTVGGVSRSFDVRLAWGLARFKRAIAQALTPAESPRREWAVADSRVPTSDQIRPAGR
jgi:hypothetical protein